MLSRLPLPGEDPCGFSASSHPARFFTDPMFTASLNKGLTGDMVMHAQYYPAIARAIELLRPVAQDAAHQADDGWQEGVESVSSICECRDQWN